MKKNSRWYVLVWVTIICVALIVLGELFTAISPHSEIVQWLASRWGYPYFQALSISIMLVSFLKVFFRQIKDVLTGIKNRVIRAISKELLQMAPGPSKHIIWKIILAVSTCAVVVSILVPNCLPADDLIVSFNIFENNVLTSHISSGETIVRSSDSYIEIEAQFELSQGVLATPDMNCEWTAYTGDGRIVQGTNCKIGYRTGKDGSPDPVAMTVTQNGCSSSLGYFSFFVKNGSMP